MQKKSKKKASRKKDGEVFSELEIARRKRINLLNVRQWLLDYSKRQLQVDTNPKFNDHFLKIFVNALTNDKIIEMFNREMFADGYVPKVWKSCVARLDVEVEFNINTVEHEDAEDIIDDFEIDVDYHDPHVRVDGAMVLSANVEYE